MDVELLGQPFSDEGRLGSILPSLLAEADSFWAITAWAQETGLHHVAEEVRALRGRGGAASIVVGVDGAVATRESLELTAELFDPALVFHDTGNRLFHPKIYCVECEGSVTLAVGSSNFTGGGLLGNYEANVLLRLDLEVAADAALLATFLEYRDLLTAPRMPCEPLTAELIERLCAEESLVASRAQREAQRRSTRGKTESVARDVFGDPVSFLPPLPRPVRAAGRRRATELGEAGATATDAAPSNARPVERWWKKMTPSDVLRKPEGSHQRNYVALSKADHDIPFKTWFRNALFGSASWDSQRMRSGAIKEVAVISFDVLIEAEPIGRYDLRVDHAETRIANQNNSPTYLNWSAMLDVIRSSDFRDWWLELARLEDGSFRLRLLRNEPVEESSS